MPKLYNITIYVEGGHRFASKNNTSQGVKDIKNKLAIPDTLANFSLSPEDELGVFFPTNGVQFMEVTYAD